MYKILKKIFETFLELQIEVEPTKLNNDKTFGRETQAKLYGTEIRNLLSALPDKAGDFIADSLSTHFFDDFDMWSFVEEEKAAGRIKHIGFSFCS